MNIWQVEIPDLTVSSDESVSDDETEESSDFCPSEINGENMDEVDDACIATFDEDEETESSESKDSTLSGFLITSTIGLIAILAFTRRRFRV